MKPKHTILLTLCLLCLLLLPAAAAADAVTYSGQIYTTYDQIYASTTLSSSEKLSLVQEMAGWTDELAAYVEWKNSGGLEAYQAAVSGGNSTSGDYGWDEAPGDGLGGGTNIEPEYSYQERQAYDAAYEAYQAEFAAEYDYPAVAAITGSGTEADPYLISSIADLQSFRDSVNSGATTSGKYWQLTEDLDLTGITWSPIGTDSISFSGTFDGNGHKISNIYISNGNRQNGLFSINYGIIKNLHVDTISITSSFSSSQRVLMSHGAGGIVGVNYGTVTNCIGNDLSVSGYSVSTDFQTVGFGSIAGLNPGTVTNCIGYGGSNIVTSTLAPFAGNIVGSNGLGMSGDTVSAARVEHTLSYDYSASLSSQISRIGGISGFVQAGNIDNNVVLGNLMSSISGYGRITGYKNDGIINNNYALQTTRINGQTVTSNDASNINGADITTEQATSKSFYQNTPGFDFSNIWYWDDTAEWQDATGTTYYGLPKLKVFQKSIPPTISAISAIPSIGGQQDTYTLSVSASTTASGGIASYQWYGRIGSSGEWQAISDGTSATYQFVPGAYALGDFYFKCIVTGADGGVIDSYDAGYTNVKVTVVLAPQITSPAATPASGPLTQTITLSADVTSTETATYQWQELIGNTWTNISGATAATATVNIADSAETLHSYRLAASNVGGTAYSSTVTYQSVAPPTFSAVSASPSQGTYTSTVQLSATVSGADSLQWQELVGSSWQNINGATSSVYSLTLTDTAATLHSYRLAATNIGGTAYSSTVTYQSVAPPVFSAFQVSPLSGGVPLSVSFSATASDTSGYRWEYSTDGTIWVQMASGASGSYTFTAEGVYYIRVIAIGTGGSTTSASATVTASVLLPEFTQISASPTSGVAPFAVTLSASATNDATFVWQMQSGSSWVQIGSGSPLTYTIPSGTSAGMVYFRAVATNQYGSTTSQTLAVEVGAAPAAEIASPAPGAVFGSNRLISFAAADAGAGVTYSWNFGDGQTGSGKTVTHSYSETGFFMVTLTTSSQFGSSEDVVRIEIVEATGDIWLAVSDISSTGASVHATVEVSPVDPGTKVWFEVLSESGTVILRSAQLPYSGPVTWEAEGLPMISGETYQVVAKSNYYGYSLPATFTLIDAVQQPHETLGTEWESGLSRDPFNVSLLVSSGIAVFGGSMGGGSVGAAVAFGVIVMFVLVGLWLRQQDVVIPLTLTLVAGWFVIGNLPGEWQPIAYTLMVVAVVAIFFYLFRKRIE